MRARSWVLVTGVAGAVLVAGAGAAAAGDGTTTLVSVSTTGVQAAGYSRSPSVSADGRYVAFVSLSSELVSGDTNGQVDIFVRDLQTGTTSRVAVSDVDPQAGGVDTLTGLSISADGRYVAFVSAADNLVPGDTNNMQDVFVRDRVTGTTSRVSVSGTGQQGNAGSAVSSSAPSISADGRFVVFDSAATNLVAGDTNGIADVFVHDRTAGTTHRVSVSGAGRQGDRSSSTASTTSISADGRFIAFDSAAAHLVPADTNNRSDVFVRDRRAGTTSLVSRSSNGAQGDDSSGEPAISANGRYVAFTSLARLVAGQTGGQDNVFVRDRGPSAG